MRDGLSARNTAARFARQAELAPEAVAVTDGTAAWSYGRLAEEAAGVLADHVPRRASASRRDLAHWQSAERHASYAREQGDGALHVDSS